ncbi:MAG: YhbY family RNA-binding protein [Spirochaetales bacterium]|nr:YhbY family RNA-binding protein [Spirochaetales bacterium]
MDSYTRNFLRKRAHELKPVVMVGKSGLDERIIQALKQALESHELVKVRFVDYKESRQDLAHKMAADTSAELISVIGNVAIIYREHEDPSERRYHAPKRGKNYT